MYVYIFIYLIITQQANPTTKGSEGINAKKREKKERNKDGWRNLLPPTRAIDALIGDEEKYGKHKKETESGKPNSSTLDHLVASYEWRKSGTF